jgi:hypothetical protein
MDELQGHLPENSYLQQYQRGKLKSGTVFCCVESIAYRITGEMYLMEWWPPHTADSYMSQSFRGNTSQ